MKPNDKWINELKENEFDFLLKNQNKLEKTPEHLDKMAFNLIDQSSELFKEKDSSPKLKLNSLPMKFSFAAACAVILIFSFIFFIYPIFFGSAKTLTVAETNGKTLLIKNGKSINIHLNDKITDKDLIQTQDNSNITLASENNSTIRINENSELQILSLKVKNKNELSGIFLKSGKLICTINLPTKFSSLKISTETNLFEITGTKFSLEVAKNNDLMLDIEEGTILVGNNFKSNEKLDFIKKTDKEIYAGFEKIMNNKIAAEKNKTLFIKRSEIDEYNSRFNSLVENTYNEIKNNKDYSKEVKNTIIEKTAAFSNSDNYINKYNKNKERTDFIINKISLGSQIFLDEKNTCITSDEKNIYISSDSSYAVYSIDPEGKKINWIFKDPLIKNITSEAKPYRNKIIFTCPENIFALNKDGTLNSNFKIEKGPNYYPTLIEVDNKLLIPAYTSIFQYDENKISILKNFIDTCGPFYISKINSNILYYDVNEQIIKKFDLINKKEIWKSEKLKSRFFSAPIIIKENIFISDSTSTLYKFNYSSKNQHPKELILNTGIMSNIVFDSGNLFFVANNGYFYKVNAENFLTAEKILKVDNNPESNKYLTKKILLSDNEIFYSTDSGNGFYYNTLNDNKKMIELKSNTPLTGTPVKINNKIYFVNLKGEIFSVE